MQLGPLPAESSQPLRDIHAAFNLLLLLVGAWVKTGTASLAYEVSRRLDTIFSGLTTATTEKQLRRTHEQAKHLAHQLECAAAVPEAEVGYEYFLELATALERSANMASLPFRELHLIFNRIIEVVRVWETSAALNSPTGELTALVHKLLTEAMGLAIQIDK